MGFGFGSSFFKNTAKGLVFGYPVTHMAVGEKLLVAFGSENQSQNGGCLEVLTVSCCWLDF